jgi:transketolase
METFDEKIVFEFAKNLRKNILKMSLSAGAASSHFGGALSCVDIVAVLFKNIINFNKKNYKDLSRDRFILSKGHACMALYSVLKEIELISEEELLTFEQSNSFLLGHPVKNIEKGIELSTGSLGMGLSISMGIALGFKKKKINSNVYVIIGDGECNEGSIWEVAMSAPKFNLDNLCVILDRNNFQQTGSGNEILNLNPLSEKWKSFNWDVLEINGHNYQDIFNSLSKQSEKPKIIIANTIKGKGFSFSENNNDWHHKVLTKNQYEDALNELEK